MRRLIAAAFSAALMLSAASAASAATSRSVVNACPSNRVAAGGFTDTGRAVYRGEIDCVVWWQVAQGRSVGVYDPSTNINRAQMATFLANLITASGGELPSNASDAFRDDNGNTHEGAINKLAAVGIVQGTSASTYNPAGQVTRAQMASFLTRAYEYRNQSTISAGANAFGDDGSNTHEGAINKLAALGGVVGASGSSYFPNQPVSRDQMAGFVARLLDALVESGQAQLPLAPPAVVGFDLPRVGGSGGLTGDCGNLRLGSASISGQLHERTLSCITSDYDPRRTHTGYSEYDLGRAYRRFTVAIGQGDTSADVNDLIRFTVYGDGRELASRNVLFGLAVPLDLDVTGVLRLRLEVANLSSDGTLPTSIAVWGSPTVSN